MIHCDAAFAATRAFLCVVSAPTDEVQFIMLLLRRSVFLGRPRPEHPCPGRGPVCTCVCCTHTGCMWAGRLIAPPRVSCSGCRHNSSCPRLLDFGISASSPVLTPGGFRLNRPHVLGLPPVCSWPAALLHAAAAAHTAAAAPLPWPAALLLWPPSSSPRSPQYGGSLRWSCARPLPETGGTASALDLHVTAGGRAAAFRRHL